MRPTSIITTFFARSLIGTAATCLLVCGVAQAQTTPAKTPAAAASGERRAAPEQLTENLSVEDASTRIDEVRVGGQIRSITVQPKGAMPSYQVTPVTGEARWKVLGF